MYNVLCVNYTSVNCKRGGKGHQMPVSQRTSLKSTETLTKLSSKLVLGPCSPRRPVTNVEPNVCPTHVHQLARGCRCFQEDTWEDLFVLLQADNTRTCSFRTVSGCQQESQGLTAAPSPAGLVTSHNERFQKSQPQPPSVLSSIFHYLQTAFLEGLAPTWVLLWRRVSGLWGPVPWEPLLQERGHHVVSREVGCRLTDFPNIGMKRKNHTCATTRCKTEKQGRCLFMSFSAKRL